VAERKTQTRRPATRQRAAAGGGPDALGRLNDSIEAAQAALKDLRSEMSRGSRDLRKTSTGRSATRARISAARAGGSPTTSTRSSWPRGASARPRPAAPAQPVGPRRGARPGARRSSSQRNSTGGLGPPCRDRVQESASARLSSMNSSTFVSRRGTRTGLGTKDRAGSRTTSGSTT
jgi:hypothetical protein